jgi:hypothetical protein
MREEMGGSTLDGWASAGTDARTFFSFGSISERTDLSDFGVAAGAEGAGVGGGASWVAAAWMEGGVSAFSTRLDEVVFFAAAGLLVADGFAAVDLGLAADALVLLGAAAAFFFEAGFSSWLFFEVFVVALDAMKL